MPRKFLSKKKNITFISLFGIIIASVLLSCSSSNNNSSITLKSEDNYIWFENSGIELRFDPSMNYKVSYRDEARSMNTFAENQAPSSDYVTIQGKEIGNFKLTGHTRESINTEFGNGVRLVLTGETRSEDGDALLEKKLNVELYDQFPDAAIFYGSYKNLSSRDITIDTTHSNVFTLDASIIDKKNKPYDMWTYQGSSIKWGIDYIFKLDKNFKRTNWMGVQPETKTGGGVPLMDYWTRETGLAIAHIEKKPQEVSFPVDIGADRRVHTDIEAQVNKTLAPQESFTTLHTTVIAHNLDYFNPLHTYSKLMAAQGLEKKSASEASYDAVWCGWGYLTDFSQDEIYQTLPKLKELGLKWVVIDDRWWDRYGDWNPRKETFPGGVNQVKQFVDSLHSDGFKVKIWWDPVAVQAFVPPPGGYRPSVMPGMTDIEKNHKDWLIMDKEGNYVRDNRGMYEMCPAVPEVHQYLKTLTKRFIEDWGFDGHKLDAYYVVPPCYNPVHHHKDPKESLEQMPETIKIIYETTKSIKPDAVTEICNCGTAQDFYQSLYTDQPVTSDPTSFEQDRRRTKAFKALWGVDSPIYNDHIEIVPEYMQQIHQKAPKETFDFASIIGTGGVPGTKFTWPKGPELMRLTPQKEQIWNKWLTIYKKKMLSKGSYRNLYDIAYDHPETHVVQKGDTLYYAFYADSWAGDIPLRGLRSGQSYQIYNYEEGKPLGKVSGSNAHLKVAFKNHLLIECIPSNS